MFADNENAAALRQVAKQRRTVVSLNQTQPIKASVLQANTLPPQTIASVGK